MQPSSPQNPPSRPTNQPSISTTATSAATSAILSSFSSPSSLFQAGLPKEALHLLHSTSSSSSPNSYILHTNQNQASTHPDHLNALTCSTLLNPSSSDQLGHLTTELTDALQALSSISSSPSLTTAQECALITHNLAIASFVQTKFISTKKIISDLILNPVSNTTNNLAPPNLFFSLCFLLLDTVLHLSPSKSSIDKESKEILSLIEKKRPAHSASEFEFRLHLYKAQVLFVQNEPQKAKKEIKSANEIYTKMTQQGITNDSSNNLINLHQSALYLKANYEYIRGNIKKSLKLCSEARSAKVGSSEDVIYFNNMGIIHQSINKPTLALLYYSKAVRILTASSSSTYFSSSGSVCSDSISIAPVLHNAGLCALDCGKHASAYECLFLSCLHSPDTFGSRPRTHYRIGEALLGVWEDEKDKYFNNQEEEGLRSRASRNQFGRLWEVRMIRVDDLQVKLNDAVSQGTKNPLASALDSFEIAKGLMAGDGGAEEDEECLVSTTLSMAFLFLEMEVYGKARECSEETLKLIAKVKASRHRRKLERKSEEEESLGEVDYESFGEGRWVELDIGDVRVKAEAYLLESSSFLNS